MPFYEYQVADGQAGCAHCSAGFEELQSMRDPSLAACPRCGAPVRRLISACSVGPSRSGLDSRARAAGFHKLQRLGKGEYERTY